MRNFLILISFTFIVASCATYTGTMQSSSLLNQNNFIYLGNVQGSSETDYLFGIGGFSVDGLVNEAKQDLYKKHPLQSGQAYVNLTVDFATAYWIVGATRKCIINVDIVQFLENNYNKPDTAQIRIFVPMNDTLQSNKNLDIKVFPYKVGDEVVYLDSENKNAEGKIILLSFANSIATIQTIQDSVNKANTEVRFSAIKKHKPVAGKYWVNEEALILISDKYYKCIILSLGNDQAKVKVIENPYMDKEILAPYNTLKVE